MPAAHPFFTDDGRAPREDILFYTELGRQASLAVTHAFLNASLDDVFIFEKSEAGVTDAIWRAAPQSPGDLVAIEIKVREAVRRKNNAVNRVVADHSMFIGHEAVFYGTGTWTIQSAGLPLACVRRVGVDAGIKRQHFRRFDVQSWGSGCTRAYFFEK